MASDSDARDVIMMAACDWVSKSRNMEWSFIVHVLSEEFCSTPTIAT